MNPHGLGTDIIEIERIRAALKRHGNKFKNSLFTEQEQTYCDRFADPAPRYAGRFVAKEALFKAFGTGLWKGVSWRDIEIINDAQGKPEVTLSPHLRAHVGEIDILLSLSHSTHYATATALIIKGSPNDKPS